MPDAAETWVANYRRAWESNDPDEIRALFTPDATYAGSPSDPNPWRGADAIVQGWLRDKDEPGSTTFEWKVLARSGELVFIQGVSVYADVTYDNLWVVRLTADNRASEFTEWYVTRK